MFFDPITAVMVPDLQEEESQTAVKSAAVSKSINRLTVAEASSKLILAELAARYGPASLQ